MPDPKKMLGSFFGNLIQGIGKKRYQDFMTKEQERLGEKANRQDQTNQLVSTALEKFLDPDTPYLERIEWGKLYKGYTGSSLPTPDPTGAPELQESKPPGGEGGGPTDLYDFFETADIGQQQDFLQKSAERAKTLAGAEAYTAQAGASEALAESRRADTAATKKGGGKVDTGAEKLKLDQLKTQFNQLNTQYDDLAKLIPRDIYGNPTIDAKDPRIKELQRIDAERNKVYNSMYGGEKKPIPGLYD